jgi:peptide/nickel transport system ATP-binding protein
MTATPLYAPLEVRGLTKHFPAGNGLIERSRVHAVDDVSFALRPGTITALVGESGSGKSTVARLLARLHDPTRGTILFEGSDVTGEKRRRDVLGYRSQVQMIFQDPFGSLNPVKTVRHHLARPLRIHKRATGGNVEERVLALLEQVGLVPPDKVADKYPHELSGGQRQRVAIAQQLICSEHYLVMDEPFSGLDVVALEKVQHMLVDVATRHEENTLIVVTHDVSSAVAVCDTIWLMGRDHDTQGRIVPGARVVETFDLIEMDLCWHPDILTRPACGDLIQRIKARFRTL